MPILNDIKFEVIIVLDNDKKIKKEMSKFELRDYAARIARDGYEHKTTLKDGSENIIFYPPCRIKEISYIKK